MLNREEVEKIAEEEIKELYSGRYSGRIFGGEPRKNSLYIWQVSLGYIMKSGNNCFIFGNIGFSLHIDGLNGKVLYKPDLEEVDKVIKIYEKRKTEILSSVKPIASSTD